MAPQHAHGVHSATMVPLDHVTAGRIDSNPRTASNEGRTLRFRQTDRLLSNRSTASQLDAARESGSLTVTKTEYDSLLQARYEYDRLTGALLQFGIKKEVLELLVDSGTLPYLRKDSTLSMSHTPATQGNQTLHDEGALSMLNILRRLSLSKRAPQEYADAHIDCRDSASGRSQTHPHPRALEHGDSGCGLDSFSQNSTYDNGIGDSANLIYPHTRRNQYQATDSLRTLHVTGLPVGTTYRDLLSVVRGGKVLSVILRSEGAASLTFFTGAEEFFYWAKHNGLYVRGKLVEVKWAHNPYRVHDHVFRKVTNSGATRNIVVHSAVKRGLFEAQIRADLEHIHNLTIIDVTFRDGNAHIATNSVANALFARTCMISRTVYKGCKIEFYPDECDIPLPNRDARKNSAQGLTKKVNVPANRFDLLSADADDSSDAESFLPFTFDGDDSDRDSLGLQSGVRLDANL